MLPAAPPAPQVGYPLGVCSLRH